MIDLFNVPHQFEMGVLPVLQSEVFQPLATESLIGTSLPNPPPK